MSNFTQCLIFILVAGLTISIAGLLVTNKRWWDSKKDLPVYTETLLDISVPVQFKTTDTDCVVLQPEYIKSVDDVFVYADKDYVVTTNVKSYSNPGKVEELYNHPVLMASDGLELPTEFVDICSLPVKTSNVITFADGTQYDVEVWSYLIDYNKIHDSFPTVILPVSTVVVHTTEQERYVFNFTLLRDDSEWKASTLVNLASEQSDVTTLETLESDLLEAHEILLSNVIGFFQHVMFKEPIQNATM